MASKQGSSLAGVVEKCDSLGDSYEDLGTYLVRPEEISRASSPDLLSFSVLSLGMESTLEADESEDLQAKGIGCQSATQKLLFAGGELTKACREAAYDRAAEIVGAVAADAAHNSKVFAARLVEVVTTGTKATTNAALDNANEATTDADAPKSAIAVTLMESTKRAITNVSAPAAAAILSGSSYVASTVASTVVSKVGNWTWNGPSVQDPPLTASWASHWRKKRSKPCLSSRKYALVMDSQPLKAQDNDHLIDVKTNESNIDQSNTPNPIRCATEPNLLPETGWVRQELQVDTGRHSHGFEARLRREQHLVEKQRRRAVLEAEEQKEEDGEYADVRRHPAFADEAESGVA